MPFCKVAKMPLTEESYAEKRHNLSVVATSHNIGEILSVLMLLAVLGSEALFMGVFGFSAGSDGAVSTTMAGKFRESGITGGWRASARSGAGVSRAEVAGVLTLVLVLRILCTLFEERLGAKRFGPRGKTVNKFVDLVLREGKVNFRMMCWMCVLAQLFILPSELAYYGADLHAAAKAATDD